MNSSMRKIFRIKLLTGLILVLAVLIVFISCEKNEELYRIPRNQIRIRPEPVNHLIIDTLVTKYDFRKKVNIQVLYTLWNYGIRNYQFDLNNDSIDDIGFSSSLTRGTNGFYSYGGSYVCALNPNTEIDFVTTNYPIAKYSIIYTNEYQQSSTIHYTENFNQNKTYPSDLSMSNMVSVNPKIHAIGDTLSQNGNWKSGCFQLLYDKTQQSYWMENIHTGIWRNVSHKFIGIRYISGRRFSYGWIELDVLANDYVINIHTSALKSIN